MECFSQLLYSALSAIEPASYITSKDRRRLQALSTQESAKRTVLVGDGLAKGWDENVLDIVRTAVIDDV